MDENNTVPAEVGDVEQVIDGTPGAPADNDAPGATRESANASGMLAKALNRAFLCSANLTTECRISI